MQTMDPQAPSVNKPIPPSSKKDNLNTKVVKEEKVDSSETDGWPFKTKTTKRDISAEVKEISFSRLKLDAEMYDMNHKRRGVALIFNHIHFESMPARNGTIKDCADLKEVLMKLEFDVRVYSDPKVSTIGSVLATIAKEDHTDADCLIVVVMSHGESGLLHAYNTLYTVDMLWEPFTGDRCPTLIGKPKLFFIQACRGEQLDKGVNVVHKTDSRGATFKIPAYADIMIAYSTYDGFYSWRNPETGSWFIQAVCDELRVNAHKRDLLTMMTFVNRRVATEYQSYVPHNEKFNEKKQIPSVVTMLTRLVYFPDNKSLLQQSEINTS